MLLADLLTTGVGIFVLFAGIVLILALIPYGLGPLLIYNAQRQSAEPQFVPFVPGQTPLPADVDKYFHQSCWALTQEGFQIVTGMFLPRQIENVIAGLVLLVNREERDAAIVVALHAEGASPTTQLHTEFVSHYPGGRLIQTNNAQPLNAFPKPENSVTSLLPSVRDPVQLYQVHKSVCRMHGSGQKLLRLDDDFGGDALRYMQAAMIEELEHACRVGYMQLDVAAAKYKPTLYGALIMTWQELWPTTAIRRAKRARQERELLSQLSFQAPGVSVV
jgi:hypothetical protein